MPTIIRPFMSFVMLIAFSGMVNASPPTNLVGSWSCELGGDIFAFANFNQDNTLATSSALSNVSSAHGTWLRTGLTTFVSKDLAFIYDSGGAAEFIQTVEADIAMSDNDNLTSTLEITIAVVDGVVVSTDSVPVSCTRTQI